MVSLPNREAVTGIWLPTSAGRVLCYSSEIYEMYLQDRASSMKYLRFGRAPTSWMNVKSNIEAVSVRVGEGGQI